MFFDDNFGKPSAGAKGGVNGGGLCRIIQDAYKGITNFILKEQAEDLKETLQKEESEARIKINVIAGKD